MGFLRTTFPALFNRSQHQWWRDSLIVLTLVVIAGLIIWWRPTLPTESELESFTNRLGVSGPLALMVTILLESIIAPIPGTFISIAAGALYGVWPGVLYVWVANVLGSTITFWIGRKLGRPVVEKIIKAQRIDAYDAFLKRNRLLVGLVYTIPILFPIDMIGYVVGLSSMSYRRFIKYMPIGFAINLLILTSFGSQLIGASTGVKVGYAIGTLIILMIAFFVQRKINRSVDKVI